MHEPISYLNSALYIEKLFYLSGKTAIVSGGTMGIVITVRLAEAGASFMIVDDVSEQEAASIPESIKQNSTSCTARVANKYILSKVL